MVDKQMIPHFKPLDVCFKISQEQLCSSIRDDHATFLVKNTLSKEEVVNKLESWFARILIPLSRAFI